MNRMGCGCTTIDAPGVSAIGPIRHTPPPFGQGLCAMCSAITEGCGGSQYEGRCPSEETLALTADGSDDHSSGFLPLCRIGRGSTRRRCIALLHQRLDVP